MLMKTTLLAIVFFVIAFSNVSAQGIMDILDRLEQLEQRLAALDKTYEAELKELRDKLSEYSEADNSVTDGQDFTVYDESILEMASRISHLEMEIEALQAELDTNYTEQRVMLAALDTEIDQISTVDQSRTERGANDINPLGFEFSGFVDGSYSVDVPTGENTFGFDQAEVDIVKNIDAVGSLRFDVEWVNDGSGGFDLDAEQGYVTFNPEFFGPVNLTFGKFNAPIGFEAVDAPDMYQYSYSNIASYGLPSNLTGAMFSAGFDFGFDFAAYVCNGWDQNVDLNSGKTFGWRLGWSGDSWGGAGLSFIRGAENSSEGDNTTVLDVDATILPLAWLTIGSELNFGREEVSGINNDWWGFLVMMHVDYSDWAGLTFRIDYFDDMDAARLGSGLEEKRTAVTLAPTFTLGDGMGALVELRYVVSDKEVFADDDGVLDKSTLGIAYEMTYTF